LVLDKYDVDQKFDETIYDIGTEALLIYEERLNSSKQKVIK